MKIVSYTICPFVQRVTALLEVKNISYDIEFINLSNKPQWFLDISPNKQVPLLITDEKAVLFESDAIVEYIEEKYPTLQPGLSPEKKAINRAWSYLATKNYLVQCSAQSSPDKESLIKRSKKLNNAFDTIEKALGQTKFFNSETLGMVDIAWLPLLHRAAIINTQSGYDFIGDRPKLKTWQKTILKIGLAEKSVSKEFNEHFIAFYLSNTTFLGSEKEITTSEITSKNKGTKSCCC